YKKRWEIETAFRAMKSSGFNIEDTHMRDMDRIERLVAMVCMALVWAYLVGEHKDINMVLRHLANLIDFAKMSAKGNIPEFEYGHI
ncbi:transposase, partial [Bacteroides acidifaciens]